MRCVRYMLFLLALPLLCSFSQDAPQLEEALTASSSLIREKLTDLRLQSEAMTLLLEELSGDLSSSRTEAAEWQERSMMLSSSLTSISEQLTSSYETITSYERRLLAAKKAVSALVTVLLLVVGVKLVCYVLYFKGVRLPRWLDILL